MKRYYGLRLMQIFYTTCALVVAIFSVGAAGFVIAEPLLAAQPIDVLRPLAILVLGGLLSLTLYVFAQLIDLLIENHKLTVAQAKRTEELLERVNKLGALVQHTTKPEVRAQRQVEERKRNLS